MTKTAIILILVTIFSKIFGFIRDIVLSYFYGASYISDAYLISLTIPLTILSFIGVGIATSYIPIYTSILKESDAERANKFTINLINFMIIICSFIVISTLIFTVPIVKVFASGFEGKTLTIGVEFTRLSVFSIYNSAIIYILTGYLQVNKNFLIPALIGFPMNVIVLASIIISTMSDIHGLAIGYVIATISQLFFLMPFVHKQGLKYKLFFDFKDNYLKKMLNLSLPVIIGVSVNQINVLVDRTLASQIVVGGISALSYANRLNLFVQGIFVTSIATVMYPKISKMYAEKNVKDFKKSLQESIISIILLLIPTTIGTMIFAKPVIKLLFGRGAFDDNAISLTSCALFYYSIGMVGFGLREVLSRSFYSLQDTKTPMINAALSMVINIVLNLILSKFLGIGGLALATSVSGIFCTVLLFINLRKKIGHFGMKNISISFFKILSTSLVMGLIVNYSYDMLLMKGSFKLALIGSIILGIIVYFGLIYFMKIEEVDILFYKIKKKINKFTN